MNIFGQRDEIGVPEENQFPQREKMQQPLQALRLQAVIQYRNHCRVDVIAQTKFSEIQRSEKTFFYCSYHCILDAGKTYDQNVNFRDMPSTFFNRSAAISFNHFQSVCIAMFFFPD